VGDIPRRDPISSLKAFSKLRRESLLKRVRGAIFVLNRFEKAHLESLGVEASVRIRTMAVDFNDLKPPSVEERSKLRRLWGLSEDSIVLISYVGVFGEEFSSLKGAHLITRLWKDLRRYLGKIVLVVTGVGKQMVEVFNKLDIKAYTLLPYIRFIELLKLSDVYFLMATPDYYGGAGVAVMEALALGKPVVSPTFSDYPELVKALGIDVPYVDSEESYRVFLESLIHIVENLDNYESFYIRDVARKYFSWESFVEEFIDMVKRL
jgi:glycosyltransferase involved in cell wall biosynthesis